MSTKTCPQCQTALPQAAKFCLSCGAPQGALVVAESQPPAIPEKRPVTRRETRTIVNVEPEPVIDGQFRVIEAIGRRREVPAGYGLLVIYGNENLKERVVVIESEGASYQEGIDPEPPARRWPESQIEIYHLSSYSSSYSSRVYYRYVQFMRIKEHRVGGFTVLGAVAVVPVGFYRVRTSRDFLSRLDRELMVEEGEITEVDLRDWRD